MYYIIKYLILGIAITVFLGNIIIAFLKNEYCLLLLNIFIWSFIDTFYLDKYAPFKN